MVNKLYNGEGHMCFMTAGYPWHVDSQSLVVVSFCSYSNHAKHLYKHIADCPIIVSPQTQWSHTK